MKYIILVLVLLFCINFSYAVNLNDPGYIDASWGMIIFAISIPFIAIFWVDHNEKEKEKNYELMQKRQIEEANYKPDLKDYHIKYLEELLKRVKYLKSFEGVPGCMKTIREEGLQGKNSITTIERDLYEDFYKDRFDSLKQLGDSLYSVPEVMRIQHLVMYLFEILREKQGYSYFLATSEDIINNIENLDAQYSIFSI